MFCSIDSVTVGVGDLESNLQFFRDRLGMRVVNDTRASVGLVAAWRRPVHESVRLIDLAGTTSVASPGSTPRKRTKAVPLSAKTLSPGRVRLAVYEDYVLTAATRAMLGDKTLPPASGPWAIELSRSDGQGGHAPNTTRVVRSPEDLLVLGVDTLETASSADKPVTANLAALWISSAHLTASSRFYTEALGLSVIQDSRYGARFPNSTGCVAFGSGDASHPHIVLASFHSPSVDQQVATSMAVGQLGFNLITARCEDLDELQKRVEALGIKPITEPTHVGLPFGYPSRVMIVAGPNGELFEFDEIVV